MVQDGEKSILSRNEEQRLKNLANGSDEDNQREDDDDQPTRFEAGLSRSGKTGTRFLL